MGRSLLIPQPVPPTMLEALESRIAPATLVNPTTLTYHDSDGDLVTVKLSKPLLTSLATANTVFHFDTGVVVASGMPDATPQQLQTIDFTGQTAFAGGGVTVTAALGAAGDGFASVGAIKAPSLKLGAVSIDGDLGAIQAGDGSGVALKSLTALTMGRFGTTTGASSLVSSFTGSVGSILVKSDIVGADLSITGTLGPLTIGGSLIGGAVVDGGCISAQSVGKVVIGGDIRGGTATATGMVESVKTIASISVGGSLLGGTGAGSGVNSTGTILAGTTIGAVTIGHNVDARSFAESGKIQAGGSIASITIGGDVIGGAAAQNAGGHSGDSGQIAALGSIGAIKIGGSLLGGAGQHSGGIYSMVKLGAISVGGDVQGGAGAQSAEIYSQSSIASLSIKGSLIGGSNTLTGYISATTSLGAVTIGGDLVGGTGQAAGGIEADGGLFTSLTIGGDIKGGTQNSAGYILASEKMGTVKIGGSLIGGSGSFTADIEADSGFTGPVTIGGSVIGGSGDGSGFIDAETGAKSITIGGDLVAGTAPGAADSGSGGMLYASGSLGTVVIKGSIIGTSAHHALISALGLTDANKNVIAIKSLTVGGSVQFGDIIGGEEDINPVPGHQVNGDAQLGKITIAGNFVASSIATGAKAGQTGFGVGDTALAGATSAIASIAGITIGGYVEGTAPGVSSTDHYGFVAEQITSLMIGGGAIPLTPGAHNDTRPLGTTGDFVLHEL